LNPETRVTLG